jgi:hypothetical protein
MEKNKYYFINAVDKDLTKIAKFSKIVEEKFDKNILTGLNFAQITDDSYLLGLTFNKKPAQEETLEIIKSFNFLKVYTEEENWVGLMAISSVCIIGSFTYKMLKIDMPYGVVKIDRATYKRLKREYEQALKENKKSFMFENTLLLVDYAKYLLQYLENRLGVNDGN